MGQVIQMLQQNEVAVIFAVQESRLRTYQVKVHTYIIYVMNTRSFLQNLAELINLRSRSSVAQLVSDGTNILNLINTEYGVRNKGQREREGESGRREKGERE